MDLNCLAVLPGFGHAWKLQQARNAECRDAANALAAGLRFNLRRRALCDDLALIDYGDAVGESVGLLKVMRGEQNGFPALDEAANLFPERAAGLHIEPDGWLIQE